MTTGSFCPRCGQLTEAGSRFCRSCGLALDFTTAVPHAPSEPKSFTERYGPSEPVSPPDELAQESSGAPRAILIIGGLVLLGVAGAIFAVNRASDDIMGSINNAVGATARPTAAPALSSRCRDELGPLVVALEDLNSRLSVGLNFQAYSEKVGDLRVAYDRIDAGALDALCVAVAGSAAEDAMNEYIAAYTAWKDCVKDIDCDGDSNTSVLQGHWATASDRINSLRGLFP